MKEINETRGSFDYKHLAIVALGLGVFFVLVSPWLFTQNWGLLDFRGTGEIGDTIGGITAPIANLTGAILVYFAFKAQVEANKLVQDQIYAQKIEDISRKKLQYLSEQINIIRADVKVFLFTYTRTITSGVAKETIKLDYYGSQGIIKLLEIAILMPEHYEGDISIKIPKLTELYRLLQIIDSLLNSIEVEGIPKEDKEYFKSTLAYHYNSKVRLAFIGKEEYQIQYIEPCKKCGIKHDKIPEKIFALVNSINNKID